MKGLITVTREEINRNYYQSRQAFPETARQRNFMIVVDFFVWKMVCEKYFSRTFTTEELTQLLVSYLSKISGKQWCILHNRDEQDTHFQIALWFSEQITDEQALFRINTVFDELYHFDKVTHKGDKYATLRYLMHIDNDSITKGKARYYPWEIICINGANPEWQKVLTDVEVDEYMQFLIFVQKKIGFFGYRKMSALRNYICTLPDRYKAFWLWVYKTNIAELKMYVDEPLEYQRDNIQRQILDSQRQILNLLNDVPSLKTKK